MLKTVAALALVTGSFLVASKGYSQALPTATGRGVLQAGGGFSFAAPDYGQRYIQGISGFFDFDPTLHFGVEADIHYIALITPDDLAENTFEVGPRYVYRRGRFAPYAKFLVGRGDLVIQETQDNPGKYSGNYFMFAVGGGLDITVKRHIVVRPIDFELQRWPSLGNGLEPVVFTAGVAWRFR